MATRVTPQATRFTVATPVAPSALAKRNVSATMRTIRTSWTTNSGAIRRVAVRFKVGPTPNAEMAIAMAKIRAHGAYDTNAGP
jgi:hypothetical protein